MCLQVVQKLLEQVQKVFAKLLLEFHGKQLREVRKHLDTVQR